MLMIEDAPRFRLEHAPLVQALVQVHFPLIAKLQTLAGLEPLQNALRDDLPYMRQTPVPQLSITIGVPSAQDVTPTIVTEFTDDSGTSLTVTAGSATLTVGGDGYPGVAEFARRFHVVCTALARHAGVGRCDRTGVRYLNAVELGSAGEGWAEWFRDELVGISRPNLVSDHLLASVSETRLQAHNLVGLDGPVTAILRHGVVPPGTVLPGMPPTAAEQQSFVLDVDLIVAGPKPFDPELLAETYRRLHRQIENIFYWAMTAAGREHFGLVEESR